VLLQSVAFFLLCANELVGFAGLFTARTFPAGVAVNAVAPELPGYIIWWGDVPPCQERLLHQASLTVGKSTHE
jgi:hypothetical protein